MDLRRPLVTRLSRLERGEEKATLPQSWRCRTRSAANSPPNCTTNSGNPSPPSAPWRPTSSVIRPGPDRHFSLDLGSATLALIRDRRD